MQTIRCVWRSKIDTYMSPKEQKVNERLKWQKHMRSNRQKMRDNWSKKTLYTHSIDRLASGLNTSSENVDILLRRKSLKEMYEKIRKKVQTMNEGHSQNSSFQLRDLTEGHEDSKAKIGVVKAWKDERKLYGKGWFRMDKFLEDA